MPISPALQDRVNEAIAELAQLREKYADVMVILDYVVLTDIANTLLDSEDEPLGQVLTEKELSFILWKVGQHVGGIESSRTVLPSIAQYTLDQRAHTDLNNT